MRLSILVFFISIFSFNSILLSQSNNKISQLKKNRAKLQKEITETEAMLKSTKKNVSSIISSINSINIQIEKRKNYIEQINSDIKDIHKELDSIDININRLKRELEERKQKYADAITKSVLKINKAEDNLMFVLSSKNLEQTYRRIRYIKEYADYQKRIAQNVIDKQKELTDKQKEFEEVKNEKEKLRIQGESEQKILQRKEQEKKAIVDELSKKQKELQQNIAKKKIEADKLNKQIDRLIAEEIERAKKRAEAAERRKREEERKRTLAKQAQNKAVEKKESINVEAENKKDAADIIANEKDIKLSGSFESNKGKLPMPISGRYVITNKFGKYNVGGLKNVVLDNKGIDIQGNANAKAISIFDGNVSAIFFSNGLYNILVRHGKYISVYCNLSSVNVKMGDSVSTGQTLGTIFTDTTTNKTELHFQLRKDIVKLNPEHWLKR